MGPDGLAMVRWLIKGAPVGKEKLLRLVKLNWETIGSGKQKDGRHDLVGFRTIQWPVFLQ